MKQYAEALGCGEERVFRVQEVVYQGNTAYQYAEIIRAEGYGLILFLNGERQSSEADEFIYHEVLVHPAMFCHPAPRQVLIIGGGEGAVAREVLRHTTVEQITQVDIDEELIAISKRYLPTWNAGAYDHPRMNLIIDDALAYLERHETQYDIIFLDIPEWSQETPARQLYTVEFYQLVLRHLTPGGVVALQVGPVHPVHSAPFLMVARRLRAVFPQVLLYPVPELRWGFGVCTTVPPNRSLFTPERLTTKLRYYNADLHAALGVVPTWVAEEL